VQPLAERANPSGPHPEWHVHLLGISVYKHKPDPQTGSFDPLAECMFENGENQVMEYESVSYPLSACVF
jgi:hypothetical protein